MAQILILLLSAIFLNADFKVKSFATLNNQDVIRQNFEESCGASAMATLLNLDGNNLTEKDVLQHLTTTDAVSLHTLEELAKNYNYQSSSYEINLDTLKKLRFPVIARIAKDIKFPHFVVIEIKNNYITMLDPSSGKYRMSLESFNKIWTKHILIVKPKNQSFKNIKNIDINNFLHLLDMK